MMELERIERLYFVRVLCPIRKKWYTTRWRMTEAEAAEKFAGEQYEIQWPTVEERRCGGDPDRITPSAWMTRNNVYGGKGRE